MFQVIGGRTVQVARLLSPRSAVLVEAVRGRKSRTDPVAKSKEDRIKVPAPVDPVEMVVLKQRFTEYQLIMRALRYVKSPAHACKMPQSSDGESRKVELLHLFTNANLTFPQPTNS